MNNILFNTWLIVFAGAKQDSMPVLGLPYLIEISATEMKYYYAYKEPMIYRVTINENKIALDNERYLTITW